MGGVGHAAWGGWSGKWVMWDMRPGVGGAELLARHLYIARTLHVQGFAVESAVAALLKHGGDVRAAAEALGGRVGGSARLAQHESCSHMASAQPAAGGSQVSLGPGQLGQLGQLGVCGAWGLGSRGLDSLGSCGLRSLGSLRFAELGGWGAWGVGSLAAAQE